MDVIASVKIHRKYFVIETVKTTTKKDRKKQNHAVEISLETCNYKKVYKETKHKTIEM